MTKLQLRIAAILDVSPTSPAAVLLSEADARRLVRLGLDPKSDVALVQKLSDSDAEVCVEMDISAADFLAAKERGAARKAEG
jgi:hypothetical protein